MTKFKDKYRVESARLRGWNYRWAGGYFVTICVKDRECVFGHAVNDDIELTPLGEIAYEYWRQIPSHHTGVEIDEFVIMPNHSHGIVIIPERAVETETLRAVETETLRATSLRSNISPKAGSLSIIIRSYKSAVTKWAGLNGYSAFAWQPRFYDRIIRDEAALNRIRQYIIDNPLKWAADDFYKS